MGYSSAAVVASAVLLTALVVLPSDSGRDIRVASQASSTVPPTTGTTDAPTTTIPAAATAPPKPVATTSPCRNSRDPKCGPFRWDPPLGPNQPMSLTVEASPSAPRVGETVTFTATAADPDEQEIGFGPPAFGDGSAGDASRCTADAVGPQYGPWTPNARRGELTYRWTHAYSASGTFIAQFRFVSGGCQTAGGQRVAYPSSAERSVTVTVMP